MVPKWFQQNQPVEGMIKQVRACEEETGEKLNEEADTWIQVIIKLVAKVYIHNSKFKL